LTGTLPINREKRKQTLSLLLHGASWRRHALSIWQKGRLVAVSGRMQVRSYEGKDGLKRYITEVVADEVQFLERMEEHKPEFKEVENDEELPF